MPVEAVGRGGTLAGMSAGVISANAVLRGDVAMCVRWPDGQTSWGVVELPAGTRVRVSLVGDGPDGWWARVHDCETPAVFAVVPMAVVEPLGVPTPAWAAIGDR